MNDTKKALDQIIGHGIDNLDNMIDYEESVEASELHHRLYNEDYFIIYTSDAKDFLDRYGVFEAIEDIKEYEQTNFGEVTTDYSDPEKVANMLAYIKGEEALGKCKTLNDNWDEPLTPGQLKAIRAELDAQL